MKKFIIIFLLLFSICKTVFPVPEMSIYIPLAVSLGIPNVKGGYQNLMPNWPTIKEPIKSIDYELALPFVSYNTGLLIQAGENFIIDNKEGINGVSVLADVGYYLYSCSFFLTIESMNI